MQAIPDSDSIGRDTKSVAVGFGGLLSCRLHLAPAEVHLWQARLDDYLAESVQHLLSDDEISRADRFHFVRDRNHFIAARGLLRTLLSAYLGSESSELQFSYTEKGKPFLKDTEPNINCNLAHSHGRAIYAFTTGREVGVDLEFIKRGLAGEKIAERFFSANEVGVLKSMPAELRNAAFFNCWTRKEAYIKARGDGLGMPLDEFDVSFRPGEPAALILNHKEPAEVTRWTMQSIPVPSGYVAAVVAEGKDWRVRRYELE